MSMNDASTTNSDRADKSWFRHDRFGMFIHWGLYSLHTGGEWMRSRRETSQQEYMRYVRRFDPDLYEPREWARAARRAGMTHMTLTAKHHDGFCLWPSGETDFHVGNTPYGRDLIAPYVEACRAEGLRVGLYFSLIDWSHPDFTIDINHPDRNLPDAIARNATRDMGRYRAFMQAQLRELLGGRYGRIDHLFMDYSYPKQSYRDMPGKSGSDWGSAELLALVRELQPTALVNNRMDLADIEADFYTPECFVPHAPPRRGGKNVDFEAAFNLNESWCYNRDERRWKSPSQLIQILVTMVSMGGNLLMNVGPDGRGVLDSGTMAALEAYGDWLKLHGRAIYGCGRSDHEAPHGCRLTEREGRVYVHLFNWPYKHLYLPGLGGKVCYAQLLNDASEIEMLPPGKLVKGEGEGLIGLDETSAPLDMLILQLPVEKPPVEVPVIELFLD
jgi:alpha-L-fucosidase